MYRNVKTFVFNRDVNISNSNILLEKKSILACNIMKVLYILRVSTCYSSSFLNFFFIVNQVMFPTTSLLLTIYYKAINIDSIK